MENPTTEHRLVLLIVKRIASTRFQCKKKSTVNHASEMCGGSDGQRWKISFTPKGRTEVTTYMKVGGFNWKILSQ